MMKVIVINNISSSSSERKKLNKMIMMFAHNSTIIQNHNYTHTKCMITTASISCYSPFLHFNNNNNNKKKKFHRCCVSSSYSVASPPQSIIISQNKPSAAEVARTIMELSSVGTLSSIITNQPEQQQLSCVGVRFAVDPEDGSPIVSLNPNHLHSPSINNTNSTLNVQLEQCAGLRTTQCTIHASLHPPSNPIHLNKLQTLWEKRFREKANSNFIHLLHVQRVLQLDNFTQDGVWISSHDYTIANPDPLRDCAQRLVDGFNTDNREDILRFCNIYVDSHVQVSDAKMVWIDRLGFDVHLYSPDNDVFEVRIPFPREVTNEKGAKSSFNGMAQQAWEVEKNYHALEFQKATQLNRIASKLQ